MQKVIPYPCESCTRWKDRSYRTFKACEEWQQQRSGLWCRAWLEWKASETSCPRCLGRYAMYPDIVAHEAVCSGCGFSTTFPDWLIEAGVIGEVEGVGMSVYFQLKKLKEAFKQARHDDFAAVCLEITCRPVVPALVKALIKVCELPDHGEGTVLKTEVEAAITSELETYARRLDHIEARLEVPNTGIKFVEALPPKNCSACGGEGSAINLTRPGPGILSCSVCKGTGKQ